MDPALDCFETVLRQILASRSDNAYELLKPAESFRLLAHAVPTAQPRVRSTEQRLARCVGSLTGCLVDLADHLDASVVEVATSPQYAGRRALSCSFISFLMLAVLDCLNGMIYLIGKAPSAVGSADKGRLAAGACALLLGPGARVLRLQLSESAETETPGPPNPAAYMAATQALVHLNSIGNIMTMLGQPGNAAAVVTWRPLGSPGALFEWLAAVGGVLLRLRRASDTGDASGANRMPEVAAAFAGVFSRLLRYDEYSDTLMADIQRQRQLLPSIVCALDLTLQQTAGGGGGGGSGSGGSTSDGTGTGSSGGRSATDDSSSSSGGSRSAGSFDPQHAWASVDDALFLVTAAPLYPALKELSRSRDSALRVLSLASAALEGQQQPSTCAQPLQLRISVCSTAVRLAGMVALVWQPSTEGRQPQPQQPSPAASPQQRQVAHAVARLLPLAAAAMRFLASTGGQASTGESATGAEFADMQLATSCYYFNILLALPTQTPAITSSTAVADWCRAADACLRLLPLLAPLPLAFRRLSLVRGLSLESGEPEIDAMLIDAPALVVQGCISLWQHFAIEATRLHFHLTQTPEGQLEVAEASARLLWQLHSTACRLVHWAATALDAEQRAKLQPFEDWLQLADAMSLTLRQAFEINRIAWTDACLGGQEKEEEAAGLERRLQSISAAHSQVLPLLALNLQKPLHSLPFEGELLFVATAAPAPLLRPELMQAFDSCIRGQLAGNDAPTVWRKVHMVFLEAENWPRFGAWLLNSGLAADGLSRAAQTDLLRSRNAADYQLARALLVSVYVVCSNLGSAALHLVEGASGGAASNISSAFGSRSSWTGSGSDSAALQRHGPAISAALRELQPTIQRVCPHRINTPFSLELMRRYIEVLLPAARKLAAALQAYWDEPEQQAAAHEELARAAALRSCAYLCCANLAGEGGPAAGEGKGSRRCSACRTAWYCSTNCSHADWRAGGHKRVCKALAEARQQQRQQS